MITSTIASGLLLSLSASPTAPPAGDLLAIRVGRAETISQGTIEHAVLLVDDGKIVQIGEDLPVERGIPVLDRPDWVVTPGLVSCFSRLGMDSRASRVTEPHLLASGELYAGQDVYRDVLEAGVTTLGLRPPGSGVPGQAVAVRPHGDSPKDMIVQDSVYLQMDIASNSSAKKMIRDLFKKADDHNGKVEKAREKWEKDQEKKNKKKKKDDDDKDKDDDKKDEGDDKFVPPTPDAKVKPILDLRDGKLSALIGINKAGDYLHLLDVIDDEDFAWSLRASLRNDIDLYKVKDKVGERGLTIVLPPRVTLQANTRRERNIPAEFDRAGATVVLTPRFDSASGHQDWMKNVGDLVAAGMNRDAALAAVTLEAARVLGLAERLGSLDPGKDANMVFWNGDPLETGTEVQAVMLEGEFVYEEAGQ